MENEFDAKQEIITLLDNSSLNQDQMNAAIKEVIEYYNLQSYIKEKFGYKHDAELQKISLNILYERVTNAEEKLSEKENEIIKYLKELDILRYENDDLKALNEGQAMRLKLCLEADIDEYVERIESLEKERLYFNSEFDKLKEQLTLNKLYLDAETACKNTEAAFKEIYKKELTAIREAEKAILQKTIDLQKELNFSNTVRVEFSDEIDKARLGLSLVKEMIEEDKFDKQKAIEILEKALY